MEKQTEEFIYGGLSAGRTLQRKIQESIASHPEGKRLYNESSMYNMAINVLARGGDPAKLIADICLGLESISKEYQQHMITCPQPKSYIIPDNLELLK